MSQFKQTIMEKEVWIINNQNEAFRNCIKTFRNLTINELQNVSKVITELISTYKKTEKLLKKSNVLLNDEVDKSPVKFIGEEIKVEKKKKKKKKDKREKLLEASVKKDVGVQADKSARPKKKYYYLNKYGGTPCRSLNGKPLRYDMNEETCQVVKLNPTNYTTEGNKRFAELFPNGVDEKRWNKNKQRIKRKINIWKKFRTPGKELIHGYFKKVWFRVTVKDITTEKRKKGYIPISNYIITTTGEKPLNPSKYDCFSSYETAKLAYEEELKRVDRTFSKYKLDLKEETKTDDDEDDVIWLVSDSDEETYESLLTEMHPILFTSELD